MRDAKRMRICCISEATSIHTQRWVNYFAQKGHEVHLISWVRGGGYASSVHLHWLARLLPRMWVLSKYLGVILWPIQTHRLVNKIKPDVLEAHWLTIAGVLAVASGFHPVILNAWGSDILVYAKRKPIWRLFIKYALKKAEVVTCNSEILKKELLQLGASPDNIRIIYIGIDTQQFNPQRRNEELRNKLGILEVPSIISLRNLSPVYNVEMLIKAVPLVLKQVPEVKFILAGDGEQRVYLNKLANSLGVSGSIRFIGYIAHDKLPEYLASSEVYVSTSLSDSTSLSLQEAMSCELPPVVTDLPGNREWVTDGQSGFIVPMNDTQALAGRIVCLLKDKGLRRRFGEVGRKIIKERTEFEREMQKMEKLLKEIVAWH